MNELLEELDDVLQFSLGPNTVNEYVKAFVVFVVLFVVFKVFKLLILKKLKKLSEETENDFDDLLINIISNIPWFFYVIIAIYFPFMGLVSTALAEQVARAIFIIVIVYSVIQAVAALFDYWIHKAALKGSKKGSKTQTNFSGLTLLVKIVLWITGLLLVLANLGINITSLIASLGIGGIAVALAAQNILGDIFSSFTLYFDKPFEIGDFVVIGEHSGTVKKIGIKTTRIKTLQGQELVVSNQELTNSRVENYKKLQKRRVVFSYNLKYENSNEKLKKSTEIIRNVIKSHKLLDLVRVNFSEFGQYGLLFECVYNVSSSKYDEFMNAKEDINFQIKGEFEKAGIEMAVLDTAIIGGA